MKKFKCRASQVYKIMGRTQKEELLNETGKEAVRAQALKDLLGYQKELVTPAIQKGIELESQAIDIISMTSLDDVISNLQQKENEHITGKGDYILGNAIRDVKCSWSIDTHPFLKDEAEKKVKKNGYDWQMASYMWLYDLEIAYVDFILLATPFDLLGKYDDAEFHNLPNKIPLHKRITSVKILRDKEKENEIIKKVNNCQQYYNDIIEKISS